MGEARKEATASSTLTKAGIGGASCAIAGVLLNPLDVVKTRMQNAGSGAGAGAGAQQGQGMLRGLRRLVQQEGGAGLCLGARATLLRELTYSSIRMGAYEPILAALTGAGAGTGAGGETQGPPSAAIKYAAALLAGGLGRTTAFPFLSSPGLASTSHV
jgi:hypothetical protein